MLFTSDVRRPKLACQSSSVRLESCGTGSIDCLHGAHRRPHEPQTAAEHTSHRPGIRRIRWIYSHQHHSHYRTDKS